MQSLPISDNATPSGAWTPDGRISRVVKIWLLTGVVMIFLQIAIGGITRLTGSGLSITRWEIVTGTVPPLNAAQWEEAFALYKQTPQYQKINQGMSLPDFQFIYFWEYFHRLWARMMFLVFIIPFGIFWWRGMFSQRLVPRLLILVLLAGLEGFFGWIMVASGLIHRPWVNAYNLTLHLTMGLVIFSHLLWTTFMAFQPYPERSGRDRDRRFAWGLLLLSFVQIALGAMMSGTKAGLFYPTWPDMKGEYLPAILFDGALWSVDSFTHYDTNPFMPALIHVLHRNTAYLLTALVVWFMVSVMRRPDVPESYRMRLWLTGGFLTLQVILGILTVLACKGTIPVGLGVMHQGGAVLLLGALLWATYAAGAGIRK
ncbi:MAG: COX15/CtaA family protein [Saprospiraceae bacterium]|nr:COX15/CtaA family protein [Saprospiraceae bacterium]